jgi:hypothetical protein
VVPRPEPSTDNVRKRRSDGDDNHQSVDKRDKRNKVVQQPQTTVEFEYGTMYSTYPYDPIKMVFL